MNNHPPIVHKGDQPAENYQPKHDIIIILDRLRSAHNVGNIFRIAETTRIQKIVTCGYTATPPHPKLQKTAMGCDTLVPFQHFNTAAEAIKAIKADSYKIYGIETIESAPIHYQAKIPTKVAFVLGNEALGISQEALELCDNYIQIPCFGFKNSLNVGNCAAIIIYEAIRQHTQTTPQ